jgi:hypothetical protein
MVGGTMGWLTYQNYKRTFFDPANDQYVAYIQSLSRARIAAKEWMVHGRATRTLELHDATGALYGACFLRPASAAPPVPAASVVCALALPTNATAGAAPLPFALALAPARYGLAVPAGGHVALTDLVSGAALGAYSGVVTWNSTVAPFAVRVVKLAVVEH